MLKKCRNVLKNTLFLELTMAIPKKWKQLDGQLSETLSVKQFSTNFDIYYNMVSQIISSGGYLS